MKINKSSRSYSRFEWWFRHLRAVQRMSKFGGGLSNDYGWSKNVDDYNISLCQYFWAANVKYWFSRYGEAIFNVVFSIIIVSIFIVFNIGMYIEHGWLGPLGIWGTVLGIFGMIALISLYRDHKDRTKFKQPSQAREYIKARKRKVCPIIEFEETIDVSN